MPEGTEHVKGPIRGEPWGRLLLLLAVLLPLAVVFLAPGEALLGGLVWFLLVLVIVAWAAWATLGPPATPGSREGDPDLRLLLEAEIPEPVSEVMEVRLGTEEAGARVFRGRLRQPAAIVYETLKHRLGEEVVPMVMEGGVLGSAIRLVPREATGEAASRGARPWVHWLLLGLTLATTTWAGAAHAGVDLVREPWRFAVGLPYALGLLAILGVHELGHYFTARRHGIRVTPPYFIPIPFALGTFGAFIQMRSPAESRRALFDVAVAGPLAGFAVAVPALLIGLRSSPVVVEGGSTAVAGMMGGTSVASSFLFALLSKLALGDAVEYGHVLRLGPLAFAGWLGLLVTALNLLPIGQLDGGHMASALFGERTGHAISTAALWSLVLLAVFVWPGLMMWAILAFFVAARGAPPLDDLTGLGPARQWLGYATFAILVAILVPVPHALWGAVGIHCPYV